MKVFLFLLTVIGGVSAQEALRGTYNNNIDITNSNSSSGINIGNNTHVENADEFMSHELVLPSAPKIDLPLLESKLFLEQETDDSSNDVNDEQQRSLTYHYSRYNNYDQWNSRSYSGKGSDRWSGSRSYNGKGSDNWRSGSYRGKGSKSASHSRSNSYDHSYSQSNSYSRSYDGKGSGQWSSHSYSGKGGKGSKSASHSRSNSYDYSRSNSNSRSYGGKGSDQWTRKPTVSIWSGIRHKR
jgi:hypothetical protein